MAYTGEISRANPSAFIFLLDQSASMQDRFGSDAPSRRKADGVADAINRLLQNLVLRCAKEEGVRDYYDVAVIGYGARVAPAFTGPLAGRELVPISDIGNFPARLEERRKKVDDGAGGIFEQTVKFPIWLDAVAQGGTPMCEALRTAERLASTWASSHQDSFPLIVINITDGEATDGDPEPIAKQLQAISTNDGSLLLFNIHISSSASAPTEFPDTEVLLPDDFARRLFRMSSYLPSHMLQAARQDGFDVSEASRGFTFNADMVALIGFIDIGTRPSNLR